MKGHVTQKDLTGLLQGRFNARKSALIESHLAACPACGASYKILKKTVAPSLGKSIRPARAVHTHVMEFYDRHAAGMERAGTAREAASTTPPRTVRYAAVFAAAACVSVLVILLFHPQYDTAPIQASRVTGHVRVDRKKLQPGQQINPGVLLTTGENSKFAIMYGKIMKLIAGPHTSISITKSHIDRKTGKVFFEMVIDKGSIIAVFNKAGNLEYTLITPHGKVSSNGSKIAMKVDPSQTRVMVKNGSANISSTGGNSVSTEEGSGYAITSNEITSALEPTDDDEDDNSTLYDKTVNELTDGDDDVVID
jgi:hypothetical protein